MKIYLIRHGETTGDIEGRYGGGYDDHLTERGREQIRATAEKLKDKDIEVIFSSPLIRTREASEIISQTINCPVKILDGLQERHYGVLSGLTKEEAMQKYPEAVKLHADYQNTDPEGESYVDFCNRVLESFKTIVGQEIKTVAVVTHGGPIKCIYRDLGKGELEKLDDGHILELDV